MEGMNFNIRKSVTTSIVENKFTFVFRDFDQVQIVS